MSKSLQDQLLNAGLVSKDQANKSRSQKQKQKKQQRKNKEEVTDETKLQAKAALDEKARKDRELNRQKQEAAEEKALRAQITQLIDINKIDRSEGTVDYKFAADGKVKKIYVTDEMVDFLSRGRIAIVKLNEAFELVPAGVAEKIAQRDESLIVLSNSSSADANSTDDEDDPYADYQIPDDLMW